MITPTPSGEFWQRVTLLHRNANNVNELGETIPIDEDVATLWASITPLSAKEILAHAEIHLDVTHEVRIRYTKDITHTDSLKYHGRTFHIDSVINIEEQGIELVLLCHEVK